MKEQRYIAIEGNIGAGKTTLANLLADKLDARLVLEEFADNPFLKNFYKNPDRYGFSLEMSFLADRFHQLQKAAETDLFHPCTIADHTAFKSLIFAQANLKGKELSLFQNFYKMLKNNLTPPDLVVFLFRSYTSLQKNITQRGRSFEQEIDVGYLKKIQASYLSFFKQQNQLPVIIINADDYDFLNRPEDVGIIQNLLSQSFKNGLNFLDN